MEREFYSSTMKVKSTKHQEDTLNFNGHPSDHYLKVGGTYGGDFYKNGAEQHYTSLNRLANGTRRPKY